MHAIRPILATFVALSLTLSGCSKSDGGRETPHAASGDSRPAVGAVLQGDQLTRVIQMHQSYVTLITARDATVYGDVDGARDLLAELATQPMPEGVSSIWAPEVLQLHVSAGRGARAELPEGVANGVGLAAQSCGSCHSATGHSPALAGQMEPPSADSPSTLMQRHAWAAQQLWDGLIIPSEERWDQGAAVLNESKLEPHSLFQSEYLAEVGAARVHQLQAATKHVLEAETWDERAEAYGTLLHSCSSCHGGQ